MKQYIGMNWQKNPEILREPQKRLRQTNKLQKKCEKRPWSDLERQKKSEAEGYHRRQTKRRQSGNDAGEFF